MFSNINSNIFGEHDSWLMVEPPQVKKRKREQEQENSTEKAIEVKRHKELDHREINKIEEDGHEVNTKRSMVWAMVMFKDWLNEKKMSTD